jgi:hypothetical protein
MEEALVLEIFEKVWERSIFRAMMTRHQMIPAR